MSIVIKILEDLWNTELNYKGIKVNIFGIPRFKNYSNNAVRVSLSRLHKKGYLDLKNNKWHTTKLGREYINKKLKNLKQFDFVLTKNAQKNLIVMFDIPQTQKREREWFRKHLQKFDYIMIQKSVWVGPSPLPKEFIDYIKKIKLQNTIKTFKLKREYNPNKNNISN